MSGLYNSLFGRNPEGPTLLGLIGITQETKEQYPLGRICDVYVNEARDRVIIFHRNYGEDGRPYDEAIAKHPLYDGKRVAEGASDETYQEYLFRLPEDPGYRAGVLRLAEDMDRTPPMAKFKKLTEDLAAGADNHMTRHAKKAGEQMFGGLLKQMSGEEERPAPGEMTKTVVDNGLGSVVILHARGGKQEEPPTSSTEGG